MKPVLQVALDLVNEHRALRIAEAAVAGGADWLEAGTPLIKSEGIGVVRRLKQSFSDKTIVADMKIMDTGAVETEMAAKAGADVVCILGAADDSTIKDAVKSARRYGSKIMVDLIGIADKKKRAVEVEKLGVDYLCLHVGIDEQMVGKTPMDMISGIVESTSLPVATAGGLNSETVVDVVKAGSTIIIVGGAITKAKDVKKATKSITKAIRQRKKISTDLYKKYGGADIRKAFSRVSTPNISDAMHQSGALYGINPIKTGFHMVGKAITVKTLDGDWAKPIQAIDKAKEGDVLVVDVNGGKTAIWGELATWSAKKKGVAGVVVDGAVRDVDDILDIDFPVFSRYVSSAAGEPKGFGEIDAEIGCGGQRVRSGDWIIGDDSGVVVVPREEAQEIANRALDVKERENRIREEIKKGSSLAKVLKLGKWEKVE